MNNVQRLHLGPESAPLQQGRSTHGRWRVAFQRAGAVPEDADPLPASLVMIQDSDRLVFAMTEGAAAAYLAEHLADHLWMRDSADGDWPETLRVWLADTAQWDGAPDGRTGFICGRLERSIAGGRIYLAWLGMNGVRLLKRSDIAVKLDTVINEDEGWTRTHGPEPVGMGLHAYRGSLFGLERLAILSSGANPLYDDLPDLAAPDLQQALEDWSVDSFRDLVLVDLRLNPVLSSPNSVTVGYRWVASDLCELYWHPSPNATTYRIEEASTTGFQDAKLLAELTDGRQVVYRFSPPTSGPRYYRVTPYNQGVPGDPSNPLSPTPMLLNTPVVQPVEWSLDGGYFLHWTTVPQATSYEVQSSESPEFSPHESQMVYRGERAETYLSYTDVPPRLYFRVRAVNVLYAPNAPSAWSESVRSPLRLETPHFTRVSQKRIEWEPVPGARQYVILVTARDQDESQGEELFTRETYSGVADQPATYRVRALRQADDQRTASEWSDPVSLTPPEETPPPRFPDLRAIRWTLVGSAIVALCFGIVLGLLGLQAYQDANATSTPTAFPQEVLQVTYSAATLNARNATAIQITADYVQGETATAQLFTQTPTPTATPNTTLTVESEFENRLTSTAAQWTDTPTPTATPNTTLTVESDFENMLTGTAVMWTKTPPPTPTPDLTETVQAAFANGLTATATVWTKTPTPTITQTPSETPDMSATMDTAFNERLTATATKWTATPAATATLPPTETPDLERTANALLAQRLTLTATVWTETPTSTATFTPVPTATATPLPTTTATPTVPPSPTPTPDWVATADGLAADETAPGCYVVNLPDVLLPVYPVVSTDSTPILDAAPRLTVVNKLRYQDRSSGAEWVQVRVEKDGRMVSGWIQMPRGVTSAQIIAGPRCP
jgi:uncharacterized protein